ALTTFILTVVALYGMGMCMSSLFMLYGREAWHTANLLQEPVYLLTGFYFPVRALGFWVALSGSLVPLTFGIDAMRQLVFGSAAMGFLPVEIEIGALAGLAVLFMVAASTALGFMERLAKREGRLTLKWQ
ncbi:MAG: ABC transporter permease, partial [Firmicutes bacterium]|nr:ABC transporter permease [Bacillota bacterium]